MTNHKTVTVLAVLGLLFLWVPIVAIAANAFNGDKLLLEWGGFTTRWLHQTLRDAEFRTDLRNSFVCAVVVAALSVAVAFTAAVGRRGLRSGRLDRADDSLVLLRMVMPEVVVVMSIFLITRLLEIELGWALVVASQVVYCSAYAFLIINARMSQLSDVYENAARDLGARPHVVFARVTVPLMVPSILVAFLMTFTFSMDDVVSPTFLGGPDVTTLPTLIMGMIRHGVTADVNAVALLAMVFSLVPLFAALTLTGVRNLGAVGTDKRG
ncbi:ABC transporter permease subunit [Nocardioides sp. GY 10127]|uniref:ABC transporter permease n=1 Tax=Nocardioides sp. GY 10127 TaxID=2569762 RepID=UPI0010A80DAA|nr:ABC transporter permease subunit [Nocardioides sp. GY 10127]TIC85690.1 ABC transporter permease subunit [Nocardioides sp. GY 10127]